MGQSSSANISSSTDSFSKKKGKKHKHKNVPQLDAQPKNVPQLDAQPTPDSNDSKDAPDKSKSSSQATGEPFVMLSYSRSNEQFLNKIRDLLLQNKVCLWYDQQISAGTDFLGNIGQAVIDCSVFVYVISPESIKSKYCQDELALAYISNKIIVPVTENLASEMFPLMDTGTKLQLARISWFVFDTPENSLKASDNFIEAVKVGISKVVENKEYGRQNSSGARVNIMRTISEPGESGEAAGLDPSTFWERHFGESKSVQWGTFIEKFSLEYKDEIDMIFKESKNKVWLMSTLHNELEIQGNEIQLTHFDRFCYTPTGRKPFWDRVQEHAVEAYSIREVFKMESSVRVEAIENLGKYKSPSVIEALLDLLRDDDNNCKAVAAISLARTETDSEIVIAQLISILDDKDRLVRESACLSLGHLKAENAVPKLVYLWRNDFISTVRDAAELALEQIGGEEANQAIHMTRVLTNEIKQLMTM